MERSDGSVTPEMWATAVKFRTLCPIEESCCDAERFDRYNRTPTETWHIRPIDCGDGDCFDLVCQCGCVSYIWVGACGTSPTVP